MRNGIPVILRIVSLTAVIFIGVTNLLAQEIFKTSIVTPYDIYSKKTGPHTSTVVMTGYTDTDQYHSTLHVSTGNGSDQVGDGSAANPWATIRHALDQITDARLSNRYVILIAAGEYSVSTIQMKEFIHLYGGFNPDNWSRDIHSNKTILDGGSRNRILICANHSKIDGFIIRNGVARGKGGAIKCDSTSPVISNNVFVNNKTLIPEDWDPEFIHEIANDGGAIAVINGAAPRILNNLFVGNETETGRGAGVAAHNRAAPLIAYNVFLNNTAGTGDPMRSSDGGGISSSFFSPSDIYYNIIIGNRSEAKNDGGGIFSELWSSLNISGNLIIANYSDDDGGGVYLSGQVHHYITEPDPVIPEERYLSKVTGNVLIGNKTPRVAHDSGFRFTNDTRVKFDRNIIFSNYGGVDFRRTMVNGKKNIFLDPVTIRESDHTARIYNSLFLNRIDDQSDIDFKDSHFRESPPLPGTDEFEKFFKNDLVYLNILSAEYVPDKFVTVLTLDRNLPEDVNPGNRVLDLDDGWAVVKSGKGETLTIWGHHEQIGEAIILPTFALNSDSEQYIQKIDPSIIRKGK